MKLQFKSTKSKKRVALTVERINERHFEQNWHYHNEFELIYYLKGSGRRVVGDHLDEFRDNDLVLVGGGLPHLWKNDDVVEKKGLDVIILKFDIRHEGFSLLSLLDFQGIKDLLRRAQRGISFSDNDALALRETLLKMTNADMVMQITLLLQVLHSLSKSADSNMLASTEFTLRNNNSEEQRLSRIMDYVTTNYTNPITLEDISKEASMTPNSLCRFFKTKTDRTIFQYLNEIRIGKACELLINGNLSISEICFETGFNSLTSFNRIFKDIKNESPRDFKRKYKVFTSAVSQHAFSA